MRRRLFYRRISLTEEPFFFLPRKNVASTIKNHYINPNKNPLRKQKHPFTSWFVTFNESTSYKKAKVKVPNWVSKGR